MCANHIYLRRIVLLFMMACLFGSCAVPRLKISYSQIMDDLGVYDQTQKADKNTPDDYKKFVVYEAVFPFCQMEKNEGEHILDYSLAIDRECEGDTIGFHYFSLIAYGESDTLINKNMILMSYSVDYWNGIDGAGAMGAGKADIDVSGGITVLSGARQKADHPVPGGSFDIKADKKHLYAQPSKMSTFFKKMGGAFKRKENKPEIRAGFRPYRTKNVHYDIKCEKSGDTIIIKSLVNKDINQVGGTKPLVLDMANISKNGLVLKKVASAQAR
ncbi:MAG: hypothetical protein JNL02_06250 [Saprospiraceae bacterium]|nr:hypothetical protein [Saprospiraceae bacterium]